MSIGTYVMDQGRVSNTASGGNFTEATLATGLQVAAGASVELRLVKQGGELARVDFVDFLPSSGGGEPVPNVAPSAVDDGGTVIEDAGADRQRQRCWPTTATAATGRRRCRSPTPACAPAATAR